MDPYSYATTGNIACQRLLEHSDALSGWVRRQNFLKKWKKKFTILYDGHVYTYKNETATKQIEEFSLKEFISVDTSIHRKGTKQLWVLDIFPAHTTNKSKHFAFPSAKDRTIWADRFSTEIRFYNENKHSYSEMPYSSFDKAWSKECLSDNVTKYIHGDENLESSSQCHPSTKSVTSLYESVRRSYGSVPVSCSENIYDDFEGYVEVSSSESYSSRQSMRSLQGYEIGGSDKACKDSAFKCSDLQVGVRRRPCPIPTLQSPRYHRKTASGIEHFHMNEPEDPSFFQPYSSINSKMSPYVEGFDDALSSDSYSSRQSMTSLQGYEIEGSDKACKDSTFKSSDLQVGVGRRPLPTQPSSPRYHRKTTTGKEHINRSKYLFGKTFCLYIIY